MLLIYFFWFTYQVCILKIFPYLIRIHSLCTEIRSSEYDVILMQSKYFTFMDENAHFYFIFLKYNAIFTAETISYFHN